MNKLNTSNIDTVINIIEQIAKELQNGDNIIYEQRQEELRWCWTNQKTKQEYFIQLSRIRRLGSNNIYLKPILEFVENKINAIDALNYINKIDKLKAFL